MAKKAFVYDGSQWVEMTSETVLPPATTSTVGGVQLTDSTSSTSVTTAATPNSVKSAYDLANTANTTANAAIAKSLVDEKGDLLVGTADNTVARLPVGTNNYVLTADSTQTAGVKWATVAAGSYAVDISGAKAGTALGLPSGAYMLTNVGSLTTITISGTEQQFRQNESKIITSLSDIGNINAAALTLFTNGKETSYVSVNFGASYGGGIYHLTCAGTGTPVTSGVGIYSYDAITWFPVEPRGGSFVANNSVHCVAYGNGIWMMGADLGVINYSTDGVSWYQGVTPSNWSSNYIKMVKYLNGIWFVGGDNSRLSTSTDNGATWTNRTTSFAQGSSAVYDIAYGNNVYVLVGSDGALSTSTNGFSWTQRTSGFSQSIIEKVVFGNGIFVASGYDGKVRTSTDGITWTARSAGIGTSTGRGLAFGNGRFLLGTSTNVLVTSTDGITWTSVSAAPTTTGGISAMGYGNGRFFYGAADYQIVTVNDGTAKMLFTPITYSAV